MQTAGVAPMWLPGWQTPKPHFYAFHDFIWPSGPFVFQSRLTKEITQIIHLRGGKLNERKCLHSILFPQAALFWEFPALRVFGEHPLCVRLCSRGQGEDIPATHGPRYHRARCPKAAQSHTTKVLLRECLMTLNAQEPFHKDAGMHLKAMCFAMFNQVIMTSGKCSRPQGSSTPVSRKTIPERRPQVQRARGVTVAPGLEDFLWEQTYRMTQDQRVMSTR